MKALKDPESFFMWLAGLLMVLGLYTLFIACAIGSWLQGWGILTEILITFMVLIALCVLTGFIAHVYKNGNGNE